MDRNLPTDDEFELTRRRLVEEVTESVETTLKKRYTWLAVLVSFLIGGGVVAITDNFTKGIRDKVQEQVVRAKVKLEDVDKLIDRNRVSLDKVQQLSNEIDTESKDIKNQIISLNEARSSAVKNLSDSLEQIKKLDDKVKSITVAMEKLQKSGNIKELKLPSITSDASVIQTIEKTKLSEYTVFIHYSYAHKQDKPEIQKLANYLKEKGYIVPGIQAVDGEDRDIRYFQDGDAKAASELGKTVSKYFKDHLDVQIKLKPLNLYERYKERNIRKGTIELWLYL